MSTYTMHWSMRWAIVIAFSGLLLLVGYNVGLSRNNALYASCEPVSWNADKPQWLECPIK